MTCSKYIIVHFDYVITVYYHYKSMINLNCHAYYKMLLLNSVWWSCKQNVMYYYLFLIQPVGENTGGIVADFFKHQTMM